MSSGLFGRPEVIVPNRWLTQVGGVPEPRRSNNIGGLLSSSDNGTMQRRHPVIWQKHTGRGDHSDTLAPDLIRAL